MRSRGEQREPMAKGAVPSAGPFSISVDPLSGLSLSSGGRVAALDTGATANSGRFTWPRHLNAAPERLGTLIAKPYPARVKFKFGNGRKN